MGGLRRAATAFDAAPAGAADESPAPGVPATLRGITRCEFAASGKLSAQTDAASMMTYARLGALRASEPRWVAGPPAAGAWA